MAKAKNTTPVSDADRPCRTRLYGAPYGRDGEAGDRISLSTAKDYARRTLQPGQHLDVIDATSGEVVARYAADAQGKVEQINV